MRIYGNDRSASPHTGVEDNNHTVDSTPPQDRPTMDSSLSVNVMSSDNAPENGPDRGNESQSLSRASPPNFTVNERQPLRIEYLPNNKPQWTRRNEAQPPLCSAQII